MVGLYLRACGVYTIPSGGIRFGLTRSSFYELLVELRVPNLWRLVRRSSTGGRDSDHAGAIARSVRIRCERALQARDEIARTFYCERPTSVLSEAMYHFDYLALLLQGAFDGLARVARRVLAAGYKKKNVAFHHKEFCAALATAGARQLCDLVTAEKATSLFALLRGLRNTVHEASLNSVGRMTHGNEGWTRILLTNNPLSAELWAHADRLGGAEDWGLSRMDYSHLRGATRANDDLFEIYPCANELTKQSLALVDEIAATTMTTPEAVTDDAWRQYSSHIFLDAPHLREAIDLLGG